MIKFKTLADAVRLAEAAHYTQVDKAGLPYIEHPRRVMQKVQAQGALPFVQIAAIFHDITEDTAYTPEILLALGFSEAAVDIVKLLDRGYSKRLFHAANAGRDLDNSGKWYLSLGPDAEDEFYYNNIKANPGAKMVKLADIDDNMEPWRQSYLSMETQERLLIKYTKAREILNA